MAHITVQQRYQIYTLLLAGKKQSEIALLLDKEKSVISSELSRNRLANGKYKPQMAE